MPRRFYEPSNGDLRLWSDPNLFVEADLQEDLSIVEEYIALSDDAREELAPRLNYTSLEEFDAELSARRERLLDILDFFDYETKIENLTVADYAWFEMEAVEAFCGEEVGKEAVLAIDGNTVTYWQHLDDEAHEIDFRLRDYKKRISGLRMYLGATTQDKLNNLTIYVADELSELGDPGTLAIQNTSISTEDAWNEINFSNTRRGKYIRLTGFGSQHAANRVRINEIQARVKTYEYN